jgi:hypothetical protein
LVEEFLYGVAPDQVTLKATVPLFTCQACDFEFTDFEAERAREAAVAKHLSPKID